MVVDLERMLAESAENIVVLVEAPHIHDPFVVVVVVKD